VVAPSCCSVTDVDVFSSRQLSPLEDPGHSYTIVLFEPGLIGALKCNGLCEYREGQRTQVSITAEHRRMRMQALFIPFRYLH
jgi:hypothetical protein